MDFFKGLTSSANPAEPPASVLAEWNKYSAGDIESQPLYPPPAAARGEAGTFLTGVQTSFWQATNAASTSLAGPSTAGPSFSLRIPTGTQLVYFAALVGGAVVFFALAIFIFLPILIISPGKFALCFTFGSMCTMASMIMLSGWEAGMQHLLSADKLPFTAVFVGSMVATIYAAVVMSSYLLSIVFSIAQVLALLYYIMSYFPGGTQGMQFALNMAGRTLMSCFGRSTTQGMPS